MASHPKFELFKSAKNGEYYFRLTAKNGETILSSEGYKEKGGAENGIESVKKNATEEQFELKESSNEKFYFVLKAKNHQVIGQSQMYASKAGAQNGIESVIKNAPVAEVEEVAA